MCDECRIKAVELKAHELINYFKTSLPQLFDIKVTYPTIELSYLEKIFIYCLVSKVKISQNFIVNSFDWDEFTAVDANGVEFILQSIIKKNYILKTKNNDGLLEKQEELNKLNRIYGYYLNNEIKQEIEFYLDMNLHSKITLTLPNNVQSIDDWKEYLYQEILITKLDIQDCKDLEKYLINKRLKEIIGLLDYVSALKKIPLQKNNALELDLMRMLKKFDLRNILAIIKYQGCMTRSRLYDLEHSDDPNDKFRKNFVFGNKIASYFDYLVKMNEKPKYAQPLPENWTFSEIELFVSAHVIGNYEKWDKFTPDEILALWVESVGMQNDEENI